MAVAPLFIADMDALKSSLRLSGIPTGADAETLVDDATLQARAAFVRRLGQARINAIVAYPSVEAPATDEENLRMIANLTESMLARLHLMSTMPVLFMDSADQDEQAWNEEGLFRTKSPFDLSTEKKALQDQIDENMTYLADEEELGSDPKLKIQTFEPATPPPQPGDSVWGSSPRRSAD
ncbi:MAG: hypothetical protein GY906_12975 [bacterium]|nr:hypothetical protein [bacterium]